MTRRGRASRDARAARRGLRVRGGHAPNASPLFFDGAGGQVIMVLGVVVPIGWFVLKNRHSVQSAWTNIGNKRPH